MLARVTDDATRVVLDVALAVLAQEVCPVQGCVDIPPAYLLVHGADDFESRPLAPLRVDISDPVQVETRLLRRAARASARRHVDLVGLAGGLGFDENRVHWVANPRDPSGIVLVAHLRQERVSLGRAQMGMPVVSLREHCAGDGRQGSARFHLVSRLLPTLRSTTLLVA
jgi:hypothetical protein